MEISERKKRLLLFLVPLLLITSQLSASKFPKPTGYVNDFADMISPAAEAAIEQIAQEVKSKTGAEIVVATVATCGGIEIEQYAVDLFMEWGIGERGKDNGILILVALEDRKVFIKTGYGMEGIVPDAEAYRIYRNIIVPGFRLGKYDEALVTAVSNIAKLILSEAGQELSSSDSASVRKYTEPIQDAETVERLKIIPIIVVVLILVTVVLTVMMGIGGYGEGGRGGRRGGVFWVGGLGGGRGGFGGGFGGFGGGSCGGGGAGGGW